MRALSRKTDVRASTALSTFESSQDEEEPTTERKTYNFLTEKLEEDEFYRQISNLRKYGTLKPMKTMEDRRDPQPQTANDDRKAPFKDKCGVILSSPRAKMLY